MLVTNVEKSKHQTWTREYKQELIHQSKKTLIKTGSIDMKFGWKTNSNRRKIVQGFVFCFLFFDILSMSTYTLIAINNISWLILYVI